MPAHAGRIVQWVADDERQVPEFGVPEAVVVHAPLYGFQAGHGIGVREVLEEETGGGEEGEACSSGGGGDTGEELKPWGSKLAEWFP